MQWSSSQGPNMFANKIGRLGIPNQQDQGGGANEDAPQANITPGAGPNPMPGSSRRSNVVPGMGPTNYNYPGAQPRGGGITSRGGFGSSNRPAITPFVDKVPDSGGDLGDAGPRVLGGPNAPPPPGFVDMVSMKDPHRGGDLGDGRYMDNKDGFDPNKDYGSGGWLSTLSPERRAEELRNMRSEGGFQNNPFRPPGPPQGNGQYMDNPMPVGPNKNANPWNQPKDYAGMGLNAPAPPQYNQNGVNLQSGFVPGRPMDPNYGNQNQANAGAQWNQPWGQLIGGVVGSPNQSYDGSGIVPANGPGMQENRWANQTDPANPGSSMLRELMLRRRMM